MNRTDPGNDPSRRGATIAPSDYRSPLFLHAVLLRSWLWIPASLVIFMAFSVFLAACVAEYRSSRSPEPSVQAAADPTAAPVATPTLTSTPEPIATAQPTAILTPEPLPSPSPTPEPTAEPLSTPEPALDPPYSLACERVEPVPDDALQKIIEQRLGEYADGFGVVVYELTTGSYAEVNPEQSYYGASLYKTGVMYEVLRQVDAGYLALDQYVTIDYFYAAQDLGTRSWEIGAQITIYEALEAAITYSDNATAYLLGDLVGWLSVDGALHELGATSTHFSWDDLPTTAGDNAILLEAISCAYGVSDASSQLMLDFLARQYVNNRLPRFLPDEALVAHKTGNWTDANHDIGVVYGPDAVYVIAVLSQYPGADNRIALLSRDVYEYFHPNAFVEHDDAEWPQ